MVIITVLTTLHGDMDTHIIITMVSTVIIITMDIQTITITIPVKITEAETMHMDQEAMV